MMLAGHFEKKRRKREREKEEGKVFKDIKKGELFGWGTSLSVDRPMEQTV